MFLYCCFVIFTIARLELLNKSYKLVKLWQKTILPRVLTSWEISNVRELTNKDLAEIWECSLNWMFPTKSPQIQTRFWLGRPFQNSLWYEFWRPPKSNDVFGKVYVSVHRCKLSEVLEKAFSLITIFYETEET